MSVKALYTSIACNRTTSSLDWGDDGLIYYAANHAIAVVNPQYYNSVKILRTLCGHKARVNTVRVVHNANAFHGGIHLASGSDDGTCILWNTSEKSSSSPKRFKLKGHERGVTSVEALVDATNNLIVATGSIDSTIKLWRAESKNEFVCFQTIDLRSGLTFGMKMFTLAGSNATMLAYTTDTDLVNLLVSQKDAGSSDATFVQVEQLRGHVDWVRGLDHISLPNSDDCLLASCSQDTFIRLWRISPRQTLTTQKTIEEIELDEDITLEERTFSVDGKDGTKHHYALALESVLQGHEGWVYGVHFCVRNDQLLLLSSSIDKTLAVWTPSESGIWMESVRVGEVGGSSLGFYGGKFSPNGRSIIGHGFQGSFHLWHEDTEQPGLWKPGTTFGGHYGAVRDLAWDPTGGLFLMTVSADQTTRIHAPWRMGQNDTWHEIGRPQVHGYDMQCLTLLSRYHLASAAEEKMIRIFQAPSNFVQNFQALCDVVEDPEGYAILQKSPLGASVPSLGLSNKAVYTVDSENVENRHVKDLYPEHYFHPVAMSSPPTEETLMQNTLWPETQKLYGHGNELYSVAASNDGSLIASACRATTADQAKILLWDTKSWRNVQQLSAHQLTVVQLCFAPNGKLLLAVSRDRTFSVFEAKHGKCDPANFELLMRSNKTNGFHTRIIWCCDWSHDSESFVTGSRDGKGVSWRRHRTNDTADATQSPPYAHTGMVEFRYDSITAVAFARKHLSEGIYLVAVGLETGSIKLFAVGEWALVFSIDVSNAHHQTVKRLSFRPHSDKHQLASCGEDGLVRIYNVET